MFIRLCTICKIAIYIELESRYDVNIIYIVNLDSFKMYFVGF